jgi:hypothetical protein
MKQVRAGTQWGPLPRPPFPNVNCPFKPQEVSTGSVSKDKWGLHPDPSAVTVVSDFVSNGQNDARSGDYLSSIDFQIRHLIMILLLLGVGTIVILWDVQGAYRTLNAKQGNWHLQVSWLIDPHGVKQFFVDFFLFFFFLLTDEDLPRLGSWLCSWRTSNAQPLSPALPPSSSLGGLSNERGVIPQYNSRPFLLSWAVRSGRQALSHPATS